MLQPAIPAKTILRLLMLAKGLSIVVPAYNSGHSLPQLVARLSPVLQTACANYELIIVNDGSRDDTWDVVKDLAAKHSWVRGIHMMRNYGQHNALLAGIRTARFDTAVTMDDDLQHPPEEIPKLLAKLEEGFDVVYGPPQQEQHGFFRDAASVVTKLALQGMMGVENARNVSAFRAFRTCLREAFSSYRSPTVSLDVLLTWATSSFAAERVRHDPRSAGRSNYNFRRLMRHALTMMTGFSAMPLRAASIIGFGFTLFGIGVLAYVIVNYLLFGTPTAGFPFLASIIAIFSGAQLFALGIIGEYLARVHFRTMDRPSYTIKESTGTPLPAEP
jgi:glycosyltransferase involved in cell wall biosynthesis